METQSDRRYRVIVALTAADRERLHRLAERHYREPRLEAARLLAEAIDREAATLSQSPRRGDRA